MICLFLDTSSDNLLVYLLNDDKIIYEKNLKALRDHSSYLVPSIREAFVKNNLELSSLDKIFVGIGPGSFTGTRIAITDAKTLAYSLNIDLVPVSSLEEFIFAVDNYDYYIPVLSERKDMIYFSVFDENKNRVIDDTYASEEEFLEFIKKYDGKIAIISDKEYKGYDCIKKEINVVNMINKLMDREPVNPHIVKPNYIKRIEVESKL